MARKNRKTNRPYTKTYRESSMEFGVVLTRNGVRTRFEAVCVGPRPGMKSRFNVRIRKVETVDGTDLKDFMNIHELSGLLRSDLEDWCTRNIPIDLREIREEFEAYERLTVYRHLSEMSVAV